MREMIDDVDSSVEWVLNNVEEYGGDKERVMLVGWRSSGSSVRAAANRVFGRSGGSESWNGALWAWPGSGWSRRRRTDVMGDGINVEVHRIVQTRFR